MRRIGVANRLRRGRRVARSVARSHDVRAMRRARGRVVDRGRGATRTSANAAMTTRVVPAFAL